MVLLYHRTTSIFPKPSIAAQQSKEKRGEGSECNGHQVSPRKRWYGQSIKIYTLTCRRPQHCVIYTRGRMDQCNRPLIDPNHVPHEASQNSRQGRTTEWWGLKHASSELFCHRQCCCLCAMVPRLVVAVGNEWRAKIFLEATIESWGVVVEWVVILWVVATMHIWCVTLVKTWKTTALNRCFWHALEQMPDRHRRHRRHRRHCPAHHTVVQT
jgi:hypothetical protein